jgi:hypothetical protein
MVLTRYYARIPFGPSLEIELSRARDARFINVSLNAKEATGLLAQVGKATCNTMIHCLEYSVDS